ncbi:hypothetical protein ACJJTC_006337 [Scirpophaga incertulas]
MTNKTVIVLCAIILGCLALPTPEEDMSIFFENVDRNARIVGGSEAADGAHPHMAALTSGVFFRSFSCGGSIIRPSMVATAAHCIVAHFSGGSLSSSLMVNIGSNNWNGGQAVRVIGNATHAEYNSQTIKHDIGLLYTETITFSEIIKPIAISYEYVDGAVSVKAAGWGRVSTNGAIPARLRELTVSTLGAQQCQDEMARSAAQLGFRPPPLDMDIELCTMHENGAGFGMCRGDSGSALYRVDTGEQVGLVSWGLPCARGAPDMFVRLSAYQEWVEERLR